MESLYRKYRPQTFGDVVGQQHIVSTLEHAIRENRLSHAYLFCGPRGTGKTTMARILAKALLCSDKHDDLPCGQCAECMEIASGVHPDVYELDAASRTGVDSIREEIINSVSFAPVRGGYKLYIIDEVHMLTTAAFNALLKTLEEPPEHVIFVLCTTDPQKILETILSRCQRFDFHRIGNEDIEGRLKYICEQENFAYDASALEMIAKHARGGLRDALSTLEQLSVFGAGSVRDADARALLGEVASSVLSKFGYALADRDVPALFAQIAEQVEQGNDLLELTRDLVSHMRDVYMVSMAGAQKEIFDCSESELAELKAEADKFTTDRLARILISLDDASLEMRNAADPRLVLEVAFTRLARPESDLTLEALFERIEMLEQKIASGAVVAAAPAPVSVAPANIEPAAPVNAEAAAPAAQPKAAVAVAPTTAPAQGVQPAQETRAHVPVTMMSKQDMNEAQRKWQTVVAKVLASAPSRGSLLQQVHIVNDTGEALVLKPSNTFTGKMIQRPETHKAMDPAIREVFGPRVVELCDSDAAVPQAYAPQPVPASVTAAAPAPQTPAAPTAQQAPVTHTPEVASTPVAPAPTSTPATFAVDATSGPTAMPAEPVDIDAARQAWVDDYVPYDELDAPVVDVPADVPAEPVASQPTVDLPWNGSANTTEDVMAVLGNAFGDGVKLMDN